MELIVNLLGEFYSGAWLFLSIPFSIFLLILAFKRIRVLILKAEMKTWKVNDIVYIKFNYGYGADNTIYKLAKKASSVGEARARIIKWNTRESLIELGDGKEYFIRTKKINNIVAKNRVRESKMDSFMEGNNGIKSKAERRDEAIGNIIDIKQEDE